MIERSYKSLIVQIAYIIIAPPRNSSMRAKEVNAIFSTMNVDCGEIFMNQRL